jgi:hypothetical protein
MSAVLLVRNRAGIVVPIMRNGAVIIGRIVLIINCLRSTGWSTLVLEMRIRIIETCALRLLPAKVIFGQRIGLLLLLQLPRGF